jgi:carbamoyl-phosphate synthase large subunit
MGIGRSFKKHCTKAPIFRNKRNGLGADGKGYTNYEQNRETNFCRLDRVFVIYDAIPIGTSVDMGVAKKIDMWFLKQYEELYTLEKKFWYKVDGFTKRAFA